MPRYWITEEHFAAATGHYPSGDDMDRVNCDLVGTAAHHMCGWCEECDQPVFNCGHKITTSEPLVKRAKNGVYKNVKTI